MSTHNIYWRGDLMSIHNICFYGELTKIVLELSSNTHLICCAVGNKWLTTKQTISGSLSTYVYGFDYFVERILSVILCIFQFHLLASLLFKGGEDPDEVTYQS